MTWELSAQDTARWQEWQRANARGALRSARQCRVAGLLLITLVLAWLAFELLRSPAVT